MYRTMSKSTRIAIVVVCGFLLGSLAAGVYGVVVADTPQAIAKRNVEQYWIVRIKLVGGTRAKSELDAAISRQSRAEKHTMAHVFGAALYEADGMAGISGCTSDYSYGCFHEFFGRVIDASGIGAIEDLDMRCKESFGPAFLACQHGIGHGLVAHIGYQTRDLERALDLCESLPDDDLIGGCRGGAMMEFNMHTMYGLDDAIRPYVYRNRLEPCASLDKKHYPACVFSLPQWWVHAIHEQTPTETTVGIYRTIGGFCVESKDRDRCFEGIGNTIFILASPGPERPADPVLAVAMCAAAQRTARDELLCRKTAANIVGIEISHEEGLRVCSGLKGASYEYCRHYAENDSAVQAGLRVPTDIP